MQRAEIYWVDFEPRKGSKQGGIRPAPVIQNDLGETAVRPVGRLSAEKMAEVELARHRSLGLRCRALV